MFTGIVTAIGVVDGVERCDGLLRVSVLSPYDPDGAAIGASIAHAGCCLTVVAREAAGPGMRHTVELAAETLALTTLGGLAPGARLNLERSLKLGEEMGGHLVTGHVDGQGEVLDLRQDGEGWRLRVRAPEAIAPLIAAKGSVAVDGVSLTVNAVDGPDFGVLIIPHTWAATTLGALRSGARVNLEADLMARYAARILSYQSIP